MRQILSVLIFWSLVHDVAAQTIGDIGVSWDATEVKTYEYVRFINKVYKGSGAEKAGIRAGDIIVSINGTKVDDLGMGFERSLTGLTGRTIPIVVQRFSETKKFVVPFTRSNPNAEIASQASVAALKSVRTLKASDFYGLVNTCLVGDCENGKGIYMEEDSVLVFATRKNGKANGSMQLRARDYYSEIDFVNGSKEGKMTIYYINGDVQVTAYRNNKKNGISLLKKNDGTEYETVYKEGEKVSGRWTIAPVVRPLNLEDESERLLKSLTKIVSRPTLDRYINVGSAYTPVSFKALSDKKNYMIQVIYLKKSGKAEGYFNYTDGKNFPFTESAVEEDVVLTLRIQSYPGKSGNIYLKSSDGGNIPARLFVIPYD